MKNNFNWPRKIDKQKIAIKIIKKKKNIVDDGQDEVDVEDEFKIQKIFTSPYIVDVYGFFEDDHQYIIIMEYVEGGELFKAIVKRGPFSEKDAAKIAQQVLIGMKVLHENNVVHRDLKPENLLFKPINNDGKAYDENSQEIYEGDFIIKIADFGLSGIIEKNKKMEKYFGTLGYAAPEVLKNVPYDKTADIWSLGCIFYCLLSGKSPFPESFDDSEEYRYGILEFPSPEWDGISDDAKEFIKYFLNPNPNMRTSLDEALEDPWIVEMAPHMEIGDLREHLKTFNLKRKLRRVMERTKNAKRLQKLMLIEEQPKTQQ